MISDVLSNKAMWHLQCADVLDGLAMLPDGCVQTVCTSPPYWALRDYNVEGQLGLEATPQAYVEAMVAVFREVRRVMRGDGTCWLNIGDSYAHNGACGGSSPDGPRNPRATDRAKQEAMNLRVPPGLKPKDLCLIPQRLAIALQDDGFWVRQIIVWEKGNPMPESVTDRCTTSHEYILLLAKSERYFFDALAIAEPSIGVLGGNFSRLYADAQPAHGAMALQRPVDTGTRNPRSVWNINSTAYSGSHFAVFPPALPRRCILAGTSQHGACGECGAPYERVVEREKSPFKDTRTPGEHTPTGNGKISGSALQKWIDEHPPQTKGWQPTCKHNADVQPCLVLDPFSGSGTTLSVAVQLGRRAIGLELSPDYVKLAERRMAREAAGFCLPFDFEEATA